MEALLFAGAFALYSAALALSLAYLRSRDEKITLLMWHLLGFALALHLGSFALRTAVFWSIPGHAGYLPIHTWFGALSMLAFLNALVFWAVEGLARLKILGAFVLPWTVAAAGAALFFAPPEAPLLKPDLRSALLNLHPLLLMAAYTAFANAAGVGLALLVQDAQLKSHKPAEICYRLPAIEELDRLQSRLILGAFVVLSAGVALGILWTKRTQGKAWGADAKILATGATWLLYGGYLAARRFAGLRGRRAALASLVAFASLLFTWMAGDRLSELHAFLSGR
ncbi:MAG TPA: hypothetical protein DCM05_09750 [Elusimicrobia bacterium]|nr:hypothetical protein [Elusimicrobiota bacterium]